MRFLVVCFCLVIIIGCHRRPVKSPDQAMRPTTLPELADDLDFATWTKALDRDIAALKKKDSGDLRFGPRVISRADYLKALNFLLQACLHDSSGRAFRQALQNHFEAYEVYGKDHWGEVLVTSYFEPVIRGSHRKTTRFSEPLYGVPRDLVEVDLSSFADTQLGLTLPGTLLRGRLLGRRVVAFPDRASIAAGALKNDAPILAWADPIDAFFLEIQGSGVVRFKNGASLAVGYASQNGHPYVPIGRFLLDVIGKDKMSQQAIEAYLRSLPPDQARALLNRNPSAVFFKPLANEGLTYLGNEVVPGRTIATDPRLFPKGALAYLSFEKPMFDSSGASEPSAWIKSSRFVLDQDIGGGVRGGGHLDLFWGKGDEAKQAAGVMRRDGRLIYFVPRAEWLQTLVRSEGGTRRW